MDAVQPAEQARPIVLRPLTLADPLRWLSAGWRDFTHHPAIGGFYGLCFMVMGWLLLKVFEQAPAWTLALSAGFLLMGPFVCLGLYQVSRRDELGEPVGWLDSLTAWRHHGGQMAIFGFVLLVLEMLWGRASLVVFAVSFDGMPDFKGSLLALLNPENLEFIIAYIAVGAVFAGLIFAVSVVSIPMMLHRQVDAITAGLTSLRLVLDQPLVMLTWGALITLLIGLALLPWFFGLLVVGPVVGHASWHAYRAAVGEEA
ncbi:MAG TPA: DUF2189 domain-containing protein [Burkholderiaceae bacterium]|nr:DUF2189 domain-containing protein [Burkholderiaceae bacterium]HMX10620.1 DUF2189 domain-containing protein [Burkholderiaceae bacterium]HMY98524.1 DUF2189 domain-containing protein [Burkholderiaceae bacterium]HNG79695.1 DUF2189 domain-containing protein [Burkholderiaceae bacterium]